MNGRNMKIKVSVKEMGWDDEGHSFGSCEHINEFPFSLNDCDFFFFFH